MDLVEYPIQSAKLQWEARQVLRDLHEIPHLLLRIKVTGTHFPRRALEAFVSIGEVRSRFVEIGPDGLSASAYFDRAPREGVVEFGYGAEVLLRFPVPFRRAVVRELDPARLPPHTRRMASE
ncbi:MAG: hypothetical protein HYR60_02980 [Acidobacteria bacterium]|nr:hypothetical protein [Acidobacteriota bacterium]